MKDRSFLTNKGISLMVFPFMTSCIITYYFVRAMLITEQWHYKRMTVFTLFLAVLWGCIFLYDQIKKSTFYARQNIKLVIFLSFLLGLFCTFFVWGQYEVHTLMPYWSIDNGIAAMETLFHSAIAENYKYTLLPSSLINSESVMRYHTFSHLIIGHIAKILDIPSYIAYNLLYPPVFFPIYIFSQIFAINCSKKYFEQLPDWKMADMLVLMLFNVGFAYEGYYDGGEGFLIKYQAGRYGRLTSESFLVSNIFTFLFAGVCFLYIKEKRDSQIAKKDNLFLLAFIPVSIFIITCTKISNGMMIVFVISWYILRKSNKKLPIKCGTIMLYFLEFAVASIMVSNNVTPGGPDSITNKFVLFATKDQFLGKYGLWGHWFVLSIMTAVFIYLEMNKHKYSLRDLKTGKTIWIEILVLSSVLLFLPGFLINIGGGSAGFFSCLVEYEALILLCGQNWYEEKTEWNKLLGVITLVWSMGMVFTNLKSNPLDGVVKYEPQGLSIQLREINSLVKGNADRYMIYLDTDAYVTQFGYPTDRECFYLYPAMTGVGVINATYKQDSEICSFRGNVVGSYYNMDNTDNTHWISFEEACEKAKENGKDFLIHIVSSGYEVVDLWN